LRGAGNYAGHLKNVLLMRFTGRGFHFLRGALTHIPICPMNEKCVVELQETEMLN
jgi:hypothetical protein